MPDKVTLEQGQTALADHAREMGSDVRAKYGLPTDREWLARLLQDDDFIRFPVTLMFESRRIEPGLFGFAEGVSENPADGYTLVIHPYLEDRIDELTAVVLYLLVSVNYGDFATCHDAECFGAAVLGMEQEVYYEWICRVADGIPRKLTA